MSIEVVNWKNLITDPVDPMDGVIIEKHFMSPMEVRKKRDVWENVEDALNLYAKKCYVKSDERLEVWEVEGEFPESFLSDSEESGDDEVYLRQHHFFCMKGGKTVHLFWEEQKESQYKYLPWKRVPGRGLGRGVVEEGEEAQVWTNDSIQKEHAAFELASRVVLTSNATDIGNNVRDMDNGHIVQLKENEQLEVMNLMTGAFPEFQNLMDKWWRQYERATSSFDSVRGETPPSGQPYRLQALVSQAGSSHFDYRREEWGIFLKELFYDWVFPHIQKKLSKGHILASDFTPEELAEIDESFVNYEAGRVALDEALNGRVVTMQDYEFIKEEARAKISTTRQRRFIDIPDGYFKDMKAKLSINITGEQKNKMATLETISTMIQTIAPLVSQGLYAPEDLRMLINKAMEESGAGISPISLSKGGVQAQALGPQQAQPPAVAPQPQPLGGRELESLRPEGAR